METNWPRHFLGDVAEVADYVANGSFAALRTYVQYIDTPDYAVLVRLADYNARWQGPFVYVDKRAFDFLRKSSLHAGDIVIANVGANAGTVFEVPELGTPMTLGPNSVLVRFHGISRFYYYYFTSLMGQRQIQSIISGSAQPKFNKTDFRKLMIPVPPLPEQRAIANILGALDDKIALNRRMNETLEAMARALFQSWFVDFDPVRAKAEGRQPVGMDAETAALFPDGFDDSAVVVSPRGWSIVTLADVTRIHDSRRIPLSSLERAQRPGTYPYYGAASVLDTVDNYLFDGIYVLMGEDGSVIDEQDHPVLQYVWGRFWVNNHAHVLEGANGISNEHLWLFLQQVNLRPYVTGAVQPKLNQANLTRIPFLLPSKQICNRFSSIVSSLFSTYRCLFDQSAALAAIRDALLPKLLSGEVRVKEAEKVVEEVTV